MFPGRARQTHRRERVKSMLGKLKVCSASTSTISRFSLPFPPLASCQLLFPLLIFDVWTFLLLRSIALSPHLRREMLWNAWKLYLLLIKVNMYTQHGCFLHQNEQQFTNADSEAYIHAWVKLNFFFLHLLQINQIDCFFVMLTSVVFTLRRENHSRKKISKGRNFDKKNLWFCNITQWFPHTSVCAPLSLGWNYADSESNGKNSLNSRISAKVCVARKCTQQQIRLKWF